MFFVFFDGFICTEESCSEMRCVPISNGLLIYAPHLLCVCLCLTNDLKGVDFGKNTFQR